MWMNLLKHQGGENHVPEMFRFNPPDLGDMGLDAHTDSDLAHLEAATATYLLEATIRKKLALLAKYFREKP